MKISRTLSLAVVGALAAGALPLVLATPAQALPPPTVVPVTAAEISSDGASGWAVESRNTGNGGFVTGTGTPPLGTGSYHLKSMVTGDKQFLHLTKVDGAPLLGRPLSSIVALTYASYASNATYSPYVNIPIHSALIDADGNGAADGTQGFAGAATGNAILVYEPVVAANSWGTNTTIGAGAPAQWRVTKPVIYAGGPSTAFTYKTYAQWLTILTDGVVSSTIGDIQFVIGDTSTAGWAGREGWIDAVTVTTTTESITYDLEGDVHLGACPITTDSSTKTITLTGDCTTHATLGIPDGWTLDGAGYTITAVDPATADFTGPVLANGYLAAGTTVNVTNLHLVGNLDTGCSSSLFGLRFDRSAGSFTHSTVSNIKYGAGSGCQSGNSVDITNLGGPTRLAFAVDDVQVTGFQKTGIRANGNVALHLTSSSVADAMLDLITASNSLQISRGARAYVSGNTFGGNDWDGNNLWSASGVLLYGAEDVTFTRNIVNGTDTDLGVYVSQDATYQAGRTTVTCNLIERDAAIDSPYDLWSTGLGADADLLAKVDARGNTVRGFATAFDNVVNETGGPCASGPVTGLAVAGAPAAVTATWTAPSALGFAPVTSYDVTLSPGGATQTVTGTTATFSGLTPATQYTVTVVPVNASGPGTPASASGTTGPGAATITQTATTDTSAAVGWSVPGTAYTAFHVVVSDAGGPVAAQDTDGDARTWTFTGLDPDTDYTLTVTPRIGGTDGGSDAASVTTNPAPVIPPTAPGPVTDAGLNGSGSSLTATWTPAIGADTYQVTLIPGGTVQTVTGTTASFSGLSLAKEYTVTIVPMNAGGAGISASASATTGPGEATITLTSTTQTSATVGWSVPGTEYTSFHVVISDVGGPVATQDTDGDARTWTFTGLSADTDYTLTVTPRIGGTDGSSDSADITTDPAPVTPPSPPGAVTGLSFGGPSTTLSASWSAVTGATSYLVTLVPGGTVQTVVGTSASFGGLTPAKEYTVTVVPMNAVGPGTSASASATTGPGEATITQTSTTQTSATVSWSVLGTEYTSFHVVISDAGGVVDTHDTDGDARIWTFTGLDADTDYTLDVTPRIGSTDGGSDAASVTTNPAPVIPPSAPGGVTALSLAGAGTTLTATWTAAPGATDYEATLSPGGAVQSVTGTSASFTIVPGKEYTVTVVAHNVSGWGPGRSTSLDTTLPTVPTGLTAAGAPTYANLTWTPSAAPSPVTSYTIVATPTVGSPVSLTVPAAGLTFPVKVSGLARNVTYAFSVTAANAFGSGPGATKVLKGTAVVATITPGSLTAGGKIKVTGTVTDSTTGKPVSGQVIHLFGKIKGGTTYGWLGAKATTSSTGRFTFFYTPDNSRRYFVSTRGADRMGADSASRYVWIRGAATLSVNHSTVPVGTTVAFTGVVHPRTGVTVSLQRKQGTTWVTVKTAIPTTSTGAYTIAWRPTTTTDYAWRVMVSGPTIAVGYSASRVLVVT